MLLLGAATSFIMTIFFVVFHAFLNPQFLAYDIIAGIITLGFVIQIILFCKVSSYRLSAVIIDVFYTLMIFALVSISGGFESPFLILLLSCPIVSFMINSYKGGVINSIWTAWVGLTFAFLTFSGYELTNQIDNINDVLLFSIIWPIIIAGTSFCMILYDIKIEAP